MADKIKYACIGTGGIGSSKHLGGYAALPDVEIVGVCDLNRDSAERAAAKNGVHSTIYTDFREMLEKEKPDIVSVCTPNNTHKELAVAALEAGCNVHLEKPIAMTLEEADAILDAEAKSGRLVQMGMNNRFTGMTILLKRLVEEGFFGEIYSARCGWERSSGIPGIGKWFTNKALSGGGALVDLGVHFLDLTMDLLGWPEPERVTGHTFSKFGDSRDRLFFLYRNFTTGVYDVEDMAEGVIQMQNGAVLNVKASWASNNQGEYRYVELLGTKGGIRLQNDNLEAYAQYGGAMFRMQPDMMSLQRPAGECAAFVDCVRTGKRPIATAAQGRKILQLMRAIYDSAEQGRELELN